MTTLIISLVLPCQSMIIQDHSNRLARREKRWTFNTWRLHGRRQLSKIPFHNHPQYQLVINDEPLARPIHEHLSEYFQKSNHE